MLSKNIQLFLRLNQNLKLFKTFASHKPNNETMRLANIDPPSLKPYLNPILKEEDYFNLKNEITIEGLFNARVHYGHKIGTLKENMKWAIFGERLGVCIFDLEITKKYLFQALKFTAYMSYQGGIILFVSTNPNQILAVEKLAYETKQYAHTRKWQDGTFTNFKNLYGATIRLPDLVIFFGTLTSVLERHPAIIECAKLAIPTIAILDSNCEPNYITYPIPGNDDSIPSFEYYLSVFRTAIERGEKIRNEQDSEYIKIINKQKK